MTQNVTNKYWLDHLNECNLPLDGEYKYELDGTGVKIYIFDSGNSNESLKESHCKWSKDNIMVYGMQLQLVIRIVSYLSLPFLSLVQRFSKRLSVIRCLRLT